MSGGQHTFEEGPDMETRDPNGLNDHIKVIIDTFYKVLWGLYLYI